MNALDRWIQDWRIREAVRFLPPGPRVLDVGCDDGALFRALGPALREGVGLDPALARTVEGDRYRLLPGAFPADAPDEMCTLWDITYQLRPFGGGYRILRPLHFADDRC
jgi:hypothetical protein